MIAGAVLGAGAGRRFGEGPKQLARLGGRRLIEHPVIALTQARAIDQVLVILGHRAAEIERETDLSGARIVRAAGWEQGLSASLQAAVRAVRGQAQALVIALADQPFLSPVAVDQTIRAAGPRLLTTRAVYDGRPGHPVLISASDFDTVLGLKGDTGARELLVRANTRIADCSGLGSPVDVDTPTELLQARRAWRWQTPVNQRP